MTSIIRVKYVEYLSNGDEAERSEATSVDREVLVNINCPIKMILNYIRKVGRVNGEFDLCDEINCQQKNVSFYEPCTRGTDILQSDLTYFIVTFERDENGQIMNLTPLLTGKAAKKYCDILSKIQRPARKSSVKSALKKHNNVQ
ncbi:PREDICTED: uncharacterized protein LOC105453960 isoform X2 [Wasmannia auropunctata]|uniref:uncharacterized protein LOC105453960 isoform X2 n=1 Tax=Wasmannia auropunctata TaxID=64793 RepID=UPI0005F01653|nr:PREDICTED: uncharacterized protein LOC105453960 isoform X2 [Wasmannia auropunctata]